MLQRSSGAAVYLARSHPQNSPATDLVIRAQAIQEANAEALRNLVKSGPISPKRVCAMPVRIHSRNLGEIDADAKGAIQLRTQDSVAGSHLGPRRRWGGVVGGSLGRVWGWNCCKARRTSRSQSSISV
jgi:hypothetical protein